ncbi:MAG: single-stranded-DNA-specific exonuclease RecJ [Clostridia bacterium]|nr:single-stranded-DNA-specific exonuclease RecJ [Clostridia bacterium]
MISREEWFVRGANIEDISRLQREAGLSPVMARIMAGRGIKEPREAQMALRKDTMGLLDGFAMADMSKGVEIVANAIKRKDKILIVGDYDADGITATSVLIRVLKDLDALFAYRIPNRVTDGYGINVNIINEAILSGVKVILTCDNGIAATEQINYAISAGLSVVVTDHHQVQGFLPPAHAVINPHRADCPYQFKELCGAGVAYKFAQCLYSQMGVDTYDDEYLLELVTIGTICDVVPMTGENRIIAKYGLNLLNNPRNVGLQALCRANGIEDKPQTTYTVGFVIGPCLNATGRLEDASLAVRLLTETDMEKAVELAGELTALNRERQRITDQDVATALEQIDAREAESPVILIYSPKISESVAGIVAGRLKETYARPAIVLCDSGEEGIAKGSARSVEGINIYEILAKCSDLMTKFGGHPMAAGLSIAVENIDKLKKKVNDIALSNGEIVTKVMIDVPMKIASATLEMAQDVAKLEPFGKDNEKPVFGDKNLKLVAHKPLGVKGKATELQLADQTGRVVRAVLFGDSAKFAGFANQAAQAGDTMLDVCYNLNVDSYAGRERLGILITNYRLSRRNG